jgi:hypothetical protein
MHPDVMTPEVFLEQRSNGTLKESYQTTSLTLRVQASAGKKIDYRFNYSVQSDTTPVKSVWPHATKQTEEL